MITITKTNDKQREGAIPSRIEWSRRLSRTAGVGSAGKASAVQTRQRIAVDHRWARMRAVMHRALPTWEDRLGGLALVIIAALILLPATENKKSHEVALFAPGQAPNVSTTKIIPVSQRDFFP